MRAVPEQADHEAPGTGLHQVGAGGAVQPGTAGVPGPIHPRRAQQGGGDVDDPGGVQHDAAASGAGTGQQEGGPGLHDIE